MHKALNKLESLLWISCLASLSVGARNFEQGISLDGPLYATIARNIARSNQWFFLECNVPDFQPYFAEHPHLGLWLLALVFKMLPAADWAARSVGHLFYVGFLWMFFLSVRKLADEKTAALSVLLLWVWYQFSNTFSNVYLDPGTLFFGAASVFLFARSIDDKMMPHSFLAGLSLAACALYKGLTVLGFLPALAYLLFASNSKKRLKASAMMALAFVLLVGIYALSVLFSSVPDFFKTYWERQMTHRFSSGWRLAHLFDSGYWKELFRYTYFLAPLALIPLFQKQPRPMLPAVLLLSFVFMFAPARLWGGQYLLMVMPWLAWLIALSFAPRVPLPVRKLVVISAAFSIIAVSVLRFLPISIHGGKPSAMKIALRDLTRSHLTHRFYMETPGVWPPFLSSASYAWYGDVVVEYVSSSRLPSADASAALATPPGSDWVASLGERGWCRFRDFEDGSLWLACAKSLIK